MTYAQKRDGNESEIIEFLRNVGAAVKQEDKSAGHDLTVVFRGVVYIAEVKAKGGKLTDREREMCQLVEMQGGGTYHILYNVDDAARMIGVE